MANRHRGEIDAMLDGTRYTLCLTLGALAELESAFGDADMLALAQRFESGRLSASDAIRIIGAGLRGRRPRHRRRGGCPHDHRGWRGRIRRHRRAIAAGDVWGRRVIAAATRNPLNDGLAPGGGPARPFPWDEVMAAGLGVLRLSPSAFWSMTPREFARAAGWLAPANARPDRAGLDQLMQRFPDQSED